MMKCSRSVIRTAVVALTALVTTVTSAAWAEEPQEYELDEILDEARNYAPLLQELEAKQDFAQARKSRADRAWWPSLQAETLLAPVPADADPSRIDENIDEIVSFNLGPYFRQTARVVLPIYTFGKITAAQELAELGVDVEVIRARQAMQEHLHRTYQAYYGMQLARAFSALLEEGDALIKETLEEMEEARAFGDADFETKDLRRLQIFNAEMDRMVLDNARLNDLTESALLYLTDLEGPIEVPAMTPEQADLPIGTLATYQELARIHRPELAQLEAGVEARQIEERLARREFLPDVFLAADFRFGWSNKDPAFQRVCRQVEEDGPCINSETLYTRPYSNPFDTLNFGVVLGMRWNLNLGQQLGRVGETEARRVEIEAQQTRAVGAIELEIEQAWREAYDARERIAIERRRYDAARRWRNQYGLQSEMGYEGDMRDLIDPLRAFYEARVGYLEAAHNYLVARVELARVVGVESLDDVDDL